MPERVDRPAGITPLLPPVESEKRRHDRKPPEKKKPSRPSSESPSRKKEKDQEGHIDITI